MSHGCTSLDQAPIYIYDHHVINNFQHEIEAFLIERQKIPPFTAFKTAHKKNEKRSRAVVFHVFTERNPKQDWKRI